MTFGDRGTSGAVARVAQSARYRTDGLELVETWADRRPFRRAESDVVLAYDERTGVPAALLGRRYAPVSTGIGWLTTPDQAHPVQRRVAARALRRAASVWTQCRAMAPILTEAWDLDRPVDFVPLGIDTDFYAEQPWDRATPTVVSAGEDRFRDHDVLVEAMRVVQRDLPEARLELATGLPIDLPDQLGRLHTERLDGRMRDLYARSSVVAIGLRPTPTGSGLTVVLEAMASGRAVVATDNPGLSDYVEHGVTGLLVPPGDVTAMAEAIGELLADPERARTMGAASSRVARERFTSERMSAALADVVHDTVGR